MINTHKDTLITVVQSESHKNMHRGIWESIRHNRVYHVCLRLQYLYFNILSFEFAIHFTTLQINRITKTQVSAVSLNKVSNTVPEFKGGFSSPTQGSKVANTQGCRLGCACSGLMVVSYSAPHAESYASTP